MLLGIDTSGAISVALARGTLDGDAPLEVLAERSDARARHHDEVLLGLVDAVLADAGAARADLSGVVTGRGPGPFTGLRVGLVTARTIAALLEIPVWGVSSLDALAHEALTHEALAEGSEPLHGPAAASAASPDTAGERTVAVALDARRREVYWGLYARTADGRLERRGGPDVAAPVEVAERFAAADLRVGSGAHLYPEHLRPTDALADVSAAHLLRVAQQLTSQGEDLASTEPLYLREPDAAKPTARKSALGLR